MQPSNEELKALLERWGIEMDENGYQKSAVRCEGCGNEVWVKITHKPAHWESDVTIVTFDYKCKYCGSKWKEYDSD